MPAFTTQALADLGRPVNATYEYQSTFDMTLIDAPGTWDHRHNSSIDWLVV
jgi:hypothetical protein